MARTVSEGHPGRCERRRVWLRRRDVRQERSEVRTSRRLCEYGDGDQLFRTRPLISSLRGLFAVGVEVEQGRAGRAHDAEHIAVSGGVVRGAAGRLHRGQLQPIVQPPRTGTPACGFGRPGRRHRGEFRLRSRQGYCADRGSARDHDAARRHARIPEGPGSQFRRQVDQEDGAGVEYPGGSILQIRAAARRRPSSRWTSVRTISRFCNTPAVRLEFPKAPC